MTQKIRPRHPEKVKNPINPIKKKPDWIRSKLNNSKEFFLTKTIVNKNNLVTVCQEANCPNITECWSKRHATFMIMGDTCTRACAFCDVKTGKPGKLDELEPIKISQAVKKLDLKHVVITSVDRDDLDDGGSNHFYQVINQTRKTNPNTTIEVLTPDFLRKGDAYKKVLEANPDVFNHNIETVPSLYLKVRPGSRYFASLELLKNAKKMNKKVFTKSGIMVGLGETKDEILQVMDDLKSADVDFLTIGQYLQPSVKHFPLDRYYTPDEFKDLGDIAKAKGFLLVSSSPLTRSSYHADEDFAKLQQNRIKQSLMPKASVKRLIECKKDLINLVLDIEKYPEFVPFCFDAKIYENKNEGDLTKIIADLTIGKGPFKDTYKSDVVFNKKEDSIFVKNIDGPLNHLSNNWTFSDKKNGITEVTFDIDFEIKNKFLNSLMVVSFQFGLEKIADAFQERAEELFGNSKN